jgi:hypothetical protein
MYALTPPSPSGAMTCECIVKMKLRMDGLFGADQTVFSPFSTTSLQMDINGIIV